MNVAMSSERLFVEITRRLGSGRISGSNWRVLDANKAVPLNYNKSEPLLDLATTRCRASSRKFDGAQREHPDSPVSLGGKSRRSDSFRSSASRSFRKRVGCQIHRRVLMAGTSYDGNSYGQHCRRSHVLLHCGVSIDIKSLVGIAIAYATTRRHLATLCVGDRIQ